MKMLLLRTLVAATIIASLSLPACAQQTFTQQTLVEGITFKLGDDVQTVKNALKTDLDPESMDTSSSSFANLNAGKTNLFLRTKGIRVFFNRAGVVEMIKFQPPFAGSISGIKLGDTEKKVRDLKGKPIKTPWQFGAEQVFLYVLDDTAYLRIDINENEGVQSIFIQK
jgi:hypothetical protein